MTWLVASLPVAAVAASVLQALPTSPESSQQPVIGPPMPPASDPGPLPLPPTPVPPTPAAAMPALPTPRGPDAVPARALAPHDFASLDRDRDGNLDPAECMADPILAQGFDGFDDNRDGRLSREEFASYQPGPADEGSD
ncbi:MAG TPA: EF-hand domain-containing protein [Stenotrophomonas sp.]|jgi:hypothetical protein